MGKYLVGWLHANQTLLRRVTGLLVIQFGGYEFAVSVRGNNQDEKIKKEVTWREFVEQ